MKTKPPLAYVKLLNLLHAVREVPSFPKLDAVEEALLGLVAAAMNDGTPLSVVSAMESLPGASPSTVHRRLKGLQRKGMIHFSADADDSRVKYVMVTPLATKYFRALSDAVRKAAQG